MQLSVTAYITVACGNHSSANQSHFIYAYSLSSSMFALLLFCEPNELLGLGDIDWDEDWSDVEELCGGSDSICCIDGDRAKESSCEALMNAECLYDVKKKEPLESDEISQLSHDNVSTGSGSRFPKCIRNDDDIEKAICSRVSKNTLKSMAGGCSVRRGI